MRAFVLALSCLMTACFAFGQNSTSTGTDSPTAVCDFNDQQQIVVRYQQVTVGKKDKDFLGHNVPYGKVWKPGKEALTLFTNSPLNINGTTVPVGAYTMFLIPERKAWTLIVSKDTDKAGEYDQSKDLVRAPMEIGLLPAPESKFSVYFAHTGPKECTMRVDIADVGAWVPFQQK